jgi:hypothetical protein
VDLSPLDSRYLSDVSILLFFTYLAVMLCGGPCCFLILSEFKSQATSFPSD